jgi:hypothetical protein
MRAFLPACFAAATLAAAPSARARDVPVRDAAQLAAAIAAAAPGDDIVLADGTYAIAHKLKAQNAGSAQAPITVRAAHALGAHIRSSGVIAFEVTGSYWSFADLDIRGVCARDTACEHAFHVVGDAAGFRLTGSRLADFNAHLKVNADEAHRLPAQGLVADNEFFDSHPRHTDNPVAPVNIDNAIGWVVRGNLIHDFQKDGTGEASYGAFVKGGSQAPLLERNVVICARDAAPFWHMVGLSFGAHGMAPALCPPHWDAARICDPEVSAGIMRNNVVRNCNDDGIYLDRGRDSKILFNTLVDTGGITFRFPGSTGEARGNLSTAPIRAADGGHFTDGGNAVGAAWTQALQHWASARPAEDSRFRTLVPPALTLPGPDPLVPDDLCGRSRIGRLDMGAVQAALGACRQR